MAEQHFSLQIFAVAVSNTDGAGGEDIVVFDIKLFFQTHAQLVGLHFSFQLRSAGAGDHKLIMAGAGQNGVGWQDGFESLGGLQDQLVRHHVTVHIIDFLKLIQRHAHHYNILIGVKDAVYVDFQCKAVRQVCLRVMVCRELKLGFRFPALDDFLFEFGNCA